MHKTNKAGGMLTKLRNLFYLVEFPVRAKISLSVVGAFFVSLLEILGVLGTYPLLLLASGQSLDNPILEKFSSFAGTNDRQLLIIYTAVGVIGAFIAKALFTISFRWWQIGFINSMEKSARVSLLRYYLDAPYQDHKRRDLSQIHTRLATSVSQAYSQAILGTTSLLTSLLTIAMMVVVTFIISPQVALIAFTIFAGFGYLIPFLLRRRLTQISKNLIEADYVSWYASMPALEAFREMRLFDVSQRFVRRYESGADMRAQANRQQGVIGELPKNIMEIVFIMSIAGLATFMFATRDQAEAVAIMGVFSVAAVRVLPAINSAIASLNIVRVGTHGVDVLNKEVSYFKKMQRYSEFPMSGDSFSGDIQIDNVTFKYEENGPAVLDKVSIQIPEFKTVAFVGSSGSGKSTLVDIVLGMLVPSQGSLLCGGKPVMEDLKGWQSQLAVVPQSVYVLPGSLKVNVAFGLDPDEINDAQVIRALELAQLGDLVDSLPNGIEEDLGQDGSRLSGGQRQRLGIARALYRNPSLLVLDEATSALDNKTEHKITKTIESLAGEMTIIMVAHRLSTIKKADIIYYMKDGRVVNQGSFSELTKTNSEFKELVELGKL
ncbi:ABC transporter ATP-binding protein [Rothia sp. P5766]|uniref:ABC transporter ATP-binding protein n=1 Tax=Rothia sp. P5766 TaxID=3402656 RepID=UPI003AE6B260